MTRGTKVIGGVGLVLVGLLLFGNGVSALFHSRYFGDYVLTDPLTIEVSSTAVVSDDVELLRGPHKCFSEFFPVHWLFSHDDVRVEGVATGPDALFIGIAPADAAAGYLDNITHDEITDWSCVGDEITDVVYTSNEGATDPAAPGTKEFWVASVSGSSGQTLDWTIETGEWALVVMNADGSPEVAADVRLGILAPSGLVPLGWVSLLVGLGAAIGGVRLVTSLPPRPDETPRWTLRGRSVLPTTLEGRVAVFFSVVFWVPFFGIALYGAVIFFVFALRKGDRSLLLVLPALVSIIAVMLAGFMIWAILGG